MRWNGEVWHWLRPMRANDMGCLRLSSKQGVAGSSPAGPIYQLLSAMRNHKHLCSDTDGQCHVSHGVDRVFLGGRSFKCEQFAHKTVRFGKQGGVSEHVRSNA